MFTNATQFISALALLMAAQLPDVVWPSGTAFAAPEAKCTSSAHRHLGIRKARLTERNNVSRPAQSGGVQILSFGP